MISKRKRFPTLQEFREWSYANEVGTAEIYEYFSNTNRVEMPEAGQEYEFTVDIFGEIKTHIGVLNYFEFTKTISIERGVDKKGKQFRDITTLTGKAISIRPITTPTRDEVLAKCKALGLTDAELEVLK